MVQRRWIALAVAAVVATIAACGGGVATGSGARLAERLVVDAR